MYDLVRDHFTDLGYRVQGEVKSCDVTALKEDLLIILELKKSLSMELLIQAVKRQRLGDLTYICIPKPKNYVKNRKFQEILYLLKRLSLGLIFCEPDRQFIEVILHPEDYNLERSKKINKKHREQIISEMQARTTSLNKGGSRGRKLMTAYREDAIRVLWICSRRETMAPRDGVKLGIVKTPSILRDNHYGWFHKVERGCYGLTESGHKALADYDQILPELTQDLLLQDQTTQDLPQDQMTQDQTIRDLHPHQTTQEISSRQLSLTKSPEQASAKQTRRTKASKANKG